MNKKIVIVLIGIIVLIVAGFLIFSLTKKAAPAPVAQVPVEEKVSTMTPAEIGLTLSSSADNKKVIMEIAKVDGLTGVDYELSYTSKGNIPRGVIGHIDVKAGKTISQEITLGTCSDVCHYDQDVSNIKLVLKVTKTDGSVSQVEQTLDLTQ